VPVEQFEPPGDVVVVEIDRERSFDCKLENPVPQAGRSGPAGQRREKAFRPKVLVDVDCEQGAS
jgi:hypothetical protein